MLVGTIIYSFHLQEFFGGDANGYDVFGYYLLKALQGDQYYRAQVNAFIGETGATAWGMLYMVAAVYGMVGRNPLAIQFINAVLGAATAPIIFLCAQHVFNNMEVSRYAALFVAFYPSIVLWWSQGLKDGPIVFVLALCILATLKLGEKLSFKYIIVLTFSLFALLSLRFSRSCASSFATPALRSVSRRRASFLASRTSCVNSCVCSCKNLLPS